MSGLSAHPVLSAASVHLVQQKNLAKHQYQGRTLSARLVRQAQQLSSDRLSARLALSSNPLSRSKSEGGAKRNVVNSEPIESLFCAELE